MSVRDTSAQAYQEIISEGVLGEMQQTVYEYLYRHGPCTASELFYHIDKARRNPTHSNVATRLGELRDMGAVLEMDKRECQVTHRKVLVWDVSHQKPVKLQRISKKQKKDAVLDKLRALLC